MSLCVLGNQVRFQRCLLRSGHQRLQNEPRQAEVLFRGLVATAAVCTHPCFVLLSARLFLLLRRLPLRQRGQV